MKRPIAIFLFILFSPNAAALTEKDDGYAWATSSFKERFDLSKDIVRKLGGNYPHTGMLSCLNSFYEKPIVSQIHSQKIGEMAKLCHVQIK